MIVLYACLLIVAVLVMKSGKNLADSAMDTADLKSLVIYYATQNGVDPRIVWGVVMTESGGNPLASNPSDPSAGLMGVTPLIGVTFGNCVGTDEEILAQLKNPQTNLRAGCGFLAHLQGQYDTLYDVGEWIQAYNEGETNFNRGIRASAAYAKKVTDYAATWV